MLVPRTENLHHPTSCVDLYCASGSPCLSELLTLTTTSYYHLKLSFHMCDNVIKIPNTYKTSEEGRKECVWISHTSWHIVSKPLSGP